MKQDDKPSNDNPDLLTILEHAPTRHLALAIAAFVAIGTAVIQYGPVVMPQGVAENLGASLYTVAAGLMCTLALRLYRVYKRS